MALTRVKASKEEVAKTDGGEYRDMVALLFVAQRAFEFDTQPTANALACHLFQTLLPILSSYIATSFPSLSINAFQARNYNTSYYYSW